jgi:nitroreductase
MELMTAIRGRHATRSYTAQPVNREEIERLIDAAVQAPSAMNLQPWAFVIVEGEDRLRRYSDEAKRVLLGSGADFSSEIRATLQQPDFNIFHGAPVLVVICATTAEQQSAEDCSLAAENLMLAAYEAGLATCPIGFSRPWLNVPETKRELGIDDTYHPVFALVLGHPSGAADHHGRRAPTIVWR